MVVRKIWALGTHVCTILSLSVLGRPMQRTDATAVVMSFPQMMKVRDLIGI